MLERFALFEHLLIDLAGRIGAALDLLRSNLNVEVQEVVVERLAEVGAELRQELLEFVFHGLIFDKDGDARCAVGRGVEREARGIGGDDFEPFGVGGVFAGEDLGKAHELVAEVVVGERLVLLLRCRGRGGGGGGGRCGRAGGVGSAMERYRAELGTLALDGGLLLGREHRGSGGRGGCRRGVGRHRRLCRGDSRSGCGLRGTLRSGRRREDGEEASCRAKPTAGAVVFKELGHLNEGELDEEALVVGGAIVDVAVVAEFQRTIEECRGALLRLFGIALTHTFCHFEEWERLGIARDEEVAEVGRETAHEMMGFETLGEDFVEREHDFGDVAAEEGVGQVEVVVVVQDVEIFDDLPVGDVAAGEGRHLVEDGEGIAHASVGFAGDDVERRFLVSVAFLVGHALEVGHHIGHLHAGEVVDLTPREDGGENLVLLGGGEDEDGVGGRFFEGFEKGVEAGLREHVHLVDDEHLVASDLRRYLHLLDEGADVVDGVVGGGVEFVDVVRTPLVESHATFAMVAGFAVLVGGEAVDRLGKDACRGGFSHTARSAEEVGVR